MLSDWLGRSLRLVRRRKPGGTRRPSHHPGPGTRGERGGRRRPIGDGDRPVTSHSWMAFGWAPRAIRIDVQVQEGAVHASRARQPGLDHRRSERSRLLEQVEATTALRHHERVVVPRSMANGLVGEQAQVVPRSRHRPQAGSCPGPSRHRFCGRPFLRSSPPTTVHASGHLNHARPPGRADRPAGQESGWDGLAGGGGEADEDAVGGHVLADQELDLIRAWRSEAALGLRPSKSRCPRTDFALITRRNQAVLEPSRQDQPGPLKSLRRHAERAEVQHRPADVHLVDLTDRPVAEEHPGRWKRAAGARRVAPGDRKQVDDA